MKKYNWAGWGDLNGFFALMLDNVTVMVFMTTILVAVFHFPEEFIYKHMIPGTAFGVLVGDLIYTWMAFRLFKKTGHTEITAMPLGLDTPSTIGITFAVLGPTYLASKDPYITWYVGMATLFFIGLLKILLVPFAGWIREKVPQAGLLGSLAGIGLCLLGFIPLLEVFALPLVGIIALGVILYALVAKLRLPWRSPAVLASVLIGTLIYYILGSKGILGTVCEPFSFKFYFALPLPNMGMFKGMAEALKFLPIAIPFGILTVVGGINVTESARVAGDEYKTGEIIFVEAFSSLIAAFCGGVAQTTPYIGHPAYKEMGSKAAYTLATGLFVGIGGMLGFISFFVDIIPKAALAPILIFVGLDIMSQAFLACPKKHAPAVAFAIFPIMADLLLIKWSEILSDLKIEAAQMSAALQHQYQTVQALGHGFILTAMLWGAILALIIDRRLRTAILYLAITALFTFFGVIHSVKPSGDVYLPWQTGSGIPYSFAIGYLMIALLLLIGIFSKADKDPVPKELEA